MARDVYEEGAVILPCVKVQSDYQDIEDVIRMCQVRIRVPDKWKGDYLALLGAARVGEREVTKLAGEVGWDRLDAFVEAWLDYSEGRMAEAIRRLPNGRLTVHTQPRPVRARARRRAAEGHRRAITDDEIEVDLRDNPDCLPFGLNLTEATARSAAMLGVMNAINGYAPANAGTFRRLHVHLRENCVVGIPRHPASCSVSTCNLPDRVGNAVQRAIAELAEGYGMAEVGLSVPGLGGRPVGTRPAHTASEPFIDQLVLRLHLRPRRPRRRRLADAGRHRRRRRVAVELGRDRRAALPGADREPPHRARHRGRGVPARRAFSLAASSTPTVGRVRAHVPQRRHDQPRARHARRRRRRDGLAGAPGRRRPSTSSISAPASGSARARRFMCRCCGGGGYGDPLEREPEPRARKTWARGS